jgi:CRISPR-associated protein Cmr1
MRRDRGSSAGESVTRAEGVAGEAPTEAQAEAPLYAALPAPRRRARRGGPSRCQISAAIEVVTPILGGGSRTRDLDEVDVIRPATVRGHLRFWWRALFAHKVEDAMTLHSRESALWGRASTGQGGRSDVEVRVEIRKKGERDTSNPMSAPQGYALWPARAENKRPTAPRRLPGTRFLLTILAPDDREADVRAAVRAWLLFGGYGGRTRRGLGSFQVTEDRGAWLPSSVTRAAFAALFGRDVFARSGTASGDTARLAGADLYVGDPARSGTGAWETALEWLREFRQGTGGGPGGRAREPGKAPEPHRPSFSNWPEADKIRQLSSPAPGGRGWAHRPLHNAIPVWPRAGFGLPIRGRFQTRDRQGRQVSEPGEFGLVWRSPSRPHDRLASPLIVKALPLAGSGFVPCALWLDRAYPAGEVFLEGKPGSGAPFDRLPGEEARFSALRGKRGLREAFLDWLVATGRARKAP